MRIAYDYQTFMLQVYGGISRYFARLAQELSEMDQQVEIFAPLHRNMYLSELPAKIVNGRHICGYPPRARRLVVAYNYLRSRSAISEWQPNLLHETYFSRLRIAPRACPVIITVYDMIFELFPDAFAANDDTAAIKRIAIGRADHVICISENTKRDLMRLYDTPDSKISVVHLGFDRFVVREQANESAPFSEKPFLLYVGERSRSYKNFTGFLKAVASSSKLLADFDVVAFGEPQLSASELSAISSLGFDENQVRQESGGDALLGRFYRSARALVYPSLYEGFGIPPLEAMANQCPVISSNTSSMPEVIGKAAEYFDPNDIGEMRQAIESVVYSDSRIDQLRRLGAERLNLFSWKKCAQETLNTYRLSAG